MSLGLIAIIVLSFLWYLFNFYLVIRCKSISKMNGMMISMSMGMSIGLIVGTIAGIHLSDNLFIATVYSMMIGLITGALIGFRLGKLAILEGVLSGVMAGMMGAMLGAMIQEVYYDSMIKVLFFIHCFISALVIKIIVDEEEIIKNVFIKIVTHPFKLGLLFVTLFLTVEISGPLFIIDQAQSHSQITEVHDDSHGNANASNQSQLKGIDKVEIGMKEYTYIPSVIQLRMNIVTEMTVTNSGTIDHDIQFEDDTIEIISHMNSGHEHDSNPQEVHIHLKPGETKTIRLIAKSKGEISFVCSLAKHEEQGMVGNFYVN